MRLYRFLRWSSLLRLNSSSCFFWFSFFSVSYWICSVIMDCVSTYSTFFRNLMSFRSGFLGNPFPLSLFELLNSILSNRLLAFSVFSLIKLLSLGVRSYILSKGVGMLLFLGFKLSLLSIEIIECIGDLVNYSLFLITGNCTVFIGLKKSAAAGLFIVDYLRILFTILSCIGVWSCKFFYWDKELLVALIWSTVIF